MRFPYHTRMNRFLRPGKTRIYTTTAALTLFPLLIWATMVPFSARWSDFASSLQSVGQVTGIAGLALFACSLILGSRFRFMERLLGPLDQVYAAHHMIGGIALGSLLIHPLALFWFYRSARPQLLTTLVIPGLQGPVTWGILSLWLMIALLVLTLYMRPRYGLWRRTHQFLGLSFFLAGLHGITISSDISVSLLLRIYLLSLAMIALALFVAYTVFNRWSVKRYVYVVTGIEHLSASVIRLKLTPKKEALPAYPGSFVFMRLNLDGALTEPHPFSLAAPPTADGTIELHIKSLGDETTNIHERASVGAEASLEGPFGAFGADAATMPHVVCIAGGIGATPFLSLLPTLPSDRHADIIYTVRDEKDAAHLPTLEAMTLAHPNIRVFPWFSDKNGYLTAGRIANLCGLPPDSNVYLCGPPPMMLGLKAQCMAMGIPSDHIHFELFSLD